ncbi:hypothetical protein [Deinococcus sp. 12RED42]|uniref:hypothetical protein n=1 Tax=Deinococcus sp. 12RED42 TaxID=2745872 RepID=UPI001E61C653|nr:hypothetical protein [Deinococcus sp. 12RED42]MCD0166119.1 hypothetical protein [Deinococcus sp. 12RED42]
MKILTVSLAALSSCSFGSSVSIDSAWQNLPVSALPSLKYDPEVKNLQSLTPSARQKMLISQSNIVDRKNQYAILGLDEGGYLEFTVWNGKGGAGAVGLNRYRGDEAVQALYLFDSAFKLRNVTDVLRVSPAEAAAFYRKITGVSPAGPVRTAVNLPRFGTSIVISLKPDDERLLAKCTVVANNDYTCGDRLDVLKLVWTGSGFRRVLLR